ncbi:putative ATP-dependent DNA helicase II [Nocardioidaceae bacterium Broad-1]|nr:putative ATP-dependent DNA helicase II [Nocardioidaceae bacterium Broad-1]
MRVVGHILEEMTTSTPRRRHFAASPFKTDPEPVIEQFESGDLVSHDSFGLGRVVNKETAAVTVDFGPQLVRIPSPFPKLAKL